ELARSRAEARDWPAAVSAFDDVRGLFYGTSSLTRARGELLDEANRDAAAALASWKLEEGTREPREALEARYLERLTAQDIPAPGWSVVMGLALLGWLGSLGVLAWRWESPRARWPWLAAAAACFGLWLLSLALMGP
ncbi:MAG: hypothetical protein FJ098_07045, partial [Deltaproteobacteria bacterium]|nr:hypothetical protein [Deltaproteobacteria bacterium]